MRCNHSDVAETTLGFARHANSLTDVPGGVAETRCVSLVATAQFHKVSPCGKGTLSVHSSRIALRPGSRTCAASETRPLDCTSGQHAVTETRHSAPLENEVGDDALEEREGVEVHPLVVGVQAAAARLELD